MKIEQLETAIEQLDSILVAVVALRNWRRVGFLVIASCFIVGSLCFDLGCRFGA